ncbi:MAG: NAD(P)/FAD-dependent oxidoreductase [Candidatus Heimdallarchaeaceae archaeon]
MDCDLAIVGSGLTGLSAAIAAHFRNPDIIIKLFGVPYDSNTAKKGEIENIPGITKVIGVDFIQQLVEQVQSFNNEAQLKPLPENKEGISQEKTAPDTQLPFPKIEITNKIVKAISKSEKGFEIKTDQETVMAYSIIISTGLPELKHTIKGEDQFVHKGVSHCAVCDGALFRGRKVIIIGRGNFVARGALFLKKYCRKVTILCPEKDLNCDKRYYKKLLASDNVKIKTQIDPASMEIFGSQVVEGVKILENGEEKQLTANAIFIELKDSPDLSFFSNIKINTDENGFIIVDTQNSTNIEGIFAAGTVTGELDYIPISMGHGYKAGISASRYLEKMKSS